MAEITNYAAIVVSDWSIRMIADDRKFQRAAAAAAAAAAGRDAVEARPGGAAGDAHHVGDANGRHGARRGRGRAPARRRGPGLPHDGGHHPAAAAPRLGEPRRLARSRHSFSNFFSILKESK